MLWQILVALSNLTALIIAMSLLEYEAAKYAHPEANWLATPTALDIGLGSLIVLLAIINLAILIFVLLRKLDHRRLLITGTAIASLLVAALILLLGDRFLPIIWPY